jgi:AhpD family alkylhydroperoxidase
MSKGGARLRDDKPAMIAETQANDSPTCFGDPTVTTPTDWPDLVKTLTGDLRNLRGGHPEVMKAFSAIAQAALAPGALDAKTKELIALGISVAVRCDDCIGFHVKAAVDQGASREEVLETLGMAIYLGAGPSVMYASRALGAFTQFEAAKVGVTP